MKFISKALLIATLSVSAAHAQSYFVQSNGIVMTVDQKGFVYDFNQFILPYMIRYKGGQFFVNDDRQLTTVDENGYIYKQDKDQLEAPKKIRFSGFNYFVENDGTTWSIDRQGLVYKSEDSNKDFKKPIATGGTYFAIEGGRDKPARLFVVTDRGAVVETKVEGLDAAKISDGGNNWFVTQDGTFYTVTRDGFVFSKKEIVGKIGKITAKGGTFLVTNNKLLAVAEDGVVSERGLVSSFGVITKTGHNYFLTQDAKFFAVDQNGEVIQKTGKFDSANIAVTSF
ncbi:MAG: hypothetical protein K2P81_17490 [Bacteriovoracaceae bacterium]|nr:hypothetical protein [Bacteriovoracaceae bacterium]